MILKIKKVLFCALILSLTFEGHFAYSFDEFSFIGEDFRAYQKSTLNIWPVIPFFPLGDFDQYGKTISQDRDQVRKEFWDELTETLFILASQGAAVELMVEPLVNALMLFDQVHDLHKAKDVINIDRSLESQFKARLDQLFQTYDIRDQQRRVQFSAGASSNLLEAYIRLLSNRQPLGKSISLPEIDPKMGKIVADDIDFVSYGTFSNLGRGIFQLTFHLTGTKTGISRSFIARGTLIDALDDLVKQVFDFFQKNVYPDWEPPHAGLSWLPMPANPNKSNGYTWPEANSYCRLRGYRIPYARELLMAESGGAYKPGGITGLSPYASYVVADQRQTTDHYVLIQGNENSTNGPIQAIGIATPKSQFWCVKGKVTADVLFYEKLWSYIRTYRSRDRELYRALETIRYEVGDFGIGGLIYWAPTQSALPRMDSMDSALLYLKARGIDLKVPSQLRGLFDFEDPGLSS